MTEQPLSHAIALFIAANQTDSVTDQERQTLLRDFANRHQMTIVGFLATERSKLGSGIRHAISLCITNQASHIIIDDVTTLSLPPKDLTEVVGMLILAGVAVIFLADGSVLDSPTLKTLHHLLSLSVLADNEARSQRIKKSLLIKKRKGAKLGGRKFGLASSESYVINQIMELRARGVSLQIICDMLEQNDIKTIQNKKWHPTTVKRIIERASEKNINKKSSAQL